MPPESRESFFKWLYEYEFDLIGLPAPHSVIYLDIEAQYARKRLLRRQAETGIDGDIHERDMAYLIQSVQSGKQAAELFGWHKVSCFVGEDERNEDELHEEIYGIITSLGI
jgi:dTMP kinase